MDDVLDIMTGLPKREKPGACMLCFFNLYRKLPSRCSADLNYVRIWLEREIEVVALDESENLVETMPCRIREGDLEGFCKRVMAESKTLMKPDMKRLMLQFRFAAWSQEQAV